MDPAALVEGRYAKFRAMGRLGQAFTEDPALGAGRSALGHQEHRTPGPSELRSPETPDPQNPEEGGL
jgi:hypothetical protein